LVGIFSLQLKISRC